MKASANFDPLLALGKVLPVLLETPSVVRPPASGWLRAVRQERGLAQAAVAKQAGLTQQAYAQFEQGETKGTLSIGNLQRSASAMDCELVYFLVPRSRLPQDSAEAVTSPDKNPTLRPTDSDGVAAQAEGFTLNLVQDHHIL
jgi:transcriptional regulator with XRE-family HTH domain